MQSAMQAKQPAIAWKTQGVNEVLRCCQGLSKLTIYDAHNASAYSRDDAVKYVGYACDEACGEK